MTNRLYIFVLVALLAPVVHAGDRTPEFLVRQLMTVWESGETHDLAAMMSPDVVYDDLANGRSLEGLDSAASYISHIHTWASEIVIEVTHVFGNDSEAAAEWVMTAIQSQPIPGRVPVATNRPIEVHGVTLITVKNGKIVRAVDSLDALGFILQLGASVDLPGGVRIPPE